MRDEFDKDQGSNPLTARIEKPDDEPEAAASIKNDVETEQITPVANSLPSGSE